jgi:error-prone DNA polymerase
MGFYSPDTIVRDAQRHGLKVRHIDVNESSWLCTIERSKSLVSNPVLRIGLRYVKRLRKVAGEILAQERTINGPFGSVNDLYRRVSQLRGNEMTSLAEVGALNSTYDPKQNANRRTALWDVAHALKSPGPLFANLETEAADAPLERMTHEERLVADYEVSGMTTGPHPMFYNRSELNRMGVMTAARLETVADAQRVIIAGYAIVTQRPGTAGGMLFQSLEDETGIANVAVMPHLFTRFRPLLSRSRFLLIEGRMQNVDGSLTVRAEKIKPLNLTGVEMTGRSFR